MDNVPDDYQVSTGSGLEAKAEVESFEERVQIVKVDNGDKELGRGKRVNKAIGFMRTFSNINC